ncbi:MAG TPA: tetratricopeptide repeat protein, partial [Nannocystis sp.]
PRGRAPGLDQFDEDDLEDMSETPAPERVDPARLTAEQREVLTAMAGSRELWTVGNLFYVLRSHGIPTERAELCALLGREHVRDEAAELASQARFHRVHMHDPIEAASLLRRAVELAPGDAALWQQLAQALLAAADPNEALLAVDRALAIQPGLAAAHFERGLVVVHVDPGAAAEAFARAAELGHQPLQARTNHATCLAMIGRRDEALQILERLTGEHPEFAEGWYSLGLAQLKLGRLDLAAHTLGRAIDLAPEHANAHYARACAHALAGAAAPAITDIARAVAIDPDLRAAIRDDADFAAITDDPEFLRLTAGEARADEALRN